MKVLGLLVVTAYLFTGCGKPSPAEMNARAEEAYKLQNYQLAIEQYNELIKEHPGSPEADDAAFRCAAIYQDNMHNPQKAVDGYNQYLTLFPEGKKAPTALFLLGYIYNNELHKLDSAAVAYKTFLAKYPNNEMTASAKFELDNLGKSADELLPATVASGQRSDTSAVGRRKN